ncbi:hypothetical protein V5R04_14455 [Jonesiaceae bacterium BS-20]|uniref:YgjV family protein n=1 Tax=Jonesiaceae bacterium BS-20 TaxID=3120821 RepID=A0AAU7DTW5_9MICO
MNWLEVFGWIGSGVLVWSLLQTRILRLRVLNLTGCVISVIYALLAGIWPILGLNAVLALINIFHLRKLTSQAANETSYSVVALQPSDAYFQFLLTKHAADIAATHPNFSGVPDDAEVYLILHIDETVGMVVLSQPTAGHAQIVLDYVTPRFRDFSPGRYLFQDSGLLRERGLASITTQPHLDAPTQKYYAAVGFSRQGDHAVLELG